MIQMESKVQVADNTGARVAKMIGVIGTRSRQAHVGDIITAHIRESIPTANVKIRRIKSFLYLKIDTHQKIVLIHFAM